ncbi:efflux RND transporter periplasmic adaptor subunit [Aliiroseovarius sp. KMU-50]|uniref:Efflux RND transporter periplasmic adaptor subunit n=1 Tax=Aliiroseovarius salicola TaxID=3009082 RepID=A0ABT4VY36_9RHOB|nr:efflux RND transporter periplasmic adaptor subunit [Aliiroseovarius sp. KMU-50]MDA5093126.1 efflux RND transporter periplasmic adaptor subunit [Aliiroseovarius sp. KMU-50]
MTFAKPILMAALAAGLTLSPALAQNPIKPVKLMEVTDQFVAIDRLFFGRVVARQTVDLAFQVGGQIIEFPVIEGDVIKAGTLIAQLDQERYSLAYEQAVLQKDQAERTLNRLSKLQGQTVSQVALDDATTQASLADIAVRKAEFDLEHTTLVAPFDALVAMRNVGNFVTTAPGTPVVRLHDMAEIRIDIDVPEILFQKANKDGDVELTAHFPASDQAYPLIVREFNAEASPVGQTYRLTLGMATPPGLLVLPGSSVDVRAHVESDDQQNVIPGTAIVADANKNLSVMIYEETETGTGVIKQVPIEARPSENGDFIVTSGLSAGQVIVAAGANRIADGDTVRPFTGYSN